MLLLLCVRGAPGRMAFACAVCGVVYAVECSVDAYLTMSGSGSSPMHAVVVLLVVHVFPVLFGMVCVMVPGGLRAISRG